MIHNEQIAAIMERMDIVEVVGYFEILKRNGNAGYKCKCLFHNEHTASMCISPRRQIFKCFGCEQGGNVIKFLTLHLKVDFKGAIRWLADFYSLPYDEHTPASTSRPTRKAPAVKPVYVEPPLTYIDSTLYRETLTGYDNNYFVQFLHTLFEADIANEVVSKYHIGTSKYYPGAVTFWQVDRAGNVLYGKVMQYDPATGKRVKQPYDKIISVNQAIIKTCEAKKSTPPEWVINYDEQSPKPRCMFGLHLLNTEPADKPIAIFESEKTAIVSDVFMGGEYICMATGGKVFGKYSKSKEGVITLNTVSEGVKAMFRPLAGRRLFFIPDLGALEDWQEMARQLSDAHTITVLSFLQDAQQAYNLPDKSDLCDYLTSDAARSELIEQCKTEILCTPGESNSDYIPVWLKFKNKGLRLQDWRRALHELAEAGTIEFVQSKAA